MFLAFFQLSWNDIILVRIIKQTSIYFDIEPDNISLIFYSN